MFVSPAFLWVLPASAVPLLLHLLHRRPPKRLVFSHLAWLKEVHKTTMPKRHLRDILLLVMRTLFLFFLILFFARPIFQKKSFLSHAAQNESIIFLIDVSASMGAIDGGRSALDGAKERLEAVLRKVSPGVKAGLIVYSDHVEQELSPTEERARLMSAIQNLKVSPRSTDILPALKQAFAMLANQPKGRKTLVVVSDQARHGWTNALEQEGRFENYDPEAHVVLWEAAAKNPNAGFSEASLQLSEEGSLKGQALLHHFSTDEARPTWLLRLQNRVVAQGRLAWTGEKTELLALQAQLPEGGYYAGQLELQPDAAPFDDVYYLAGRVPKGFRLLIVDGESGLAPADAETYYLQSALESPRDPRLESIHVLHPESLATESLDKYDVIVLANVGDGSSKETELVSWVEQGGGLFLTAGAKWPKAPHAPLHFFRTKNKHTGSEKVSSPNPTAAFLSNVSGLEKFQWDQIDVENYFVLGPESATKPLISLKNGDPLLVRKQVGKGVVLCLTTTVDRAWTNLAAKPIFAPLVRELIAALADPLREQTTLNGFVGEPLRLRVPAGVRSVSVIAPDGVVSGATVNKEGVMEWPTPTGPGLYHVKTDRKETDFDFAVNIPHLECEGDLTRITEKEAQKVFPNAAVELLMDKNRRVEVFTAALQGRDLASALLASLFLLFVGETALGWPRREPV